MVFLDSAPVIYFVEQPPKWGAIASARVLELQASGEELAVSDLVRMECRVHPLKLQDMARLELLYAFFASPDIRVLPISAAVCDRAALIRATYGFKPLAEQQQIVAEVAEKLSQIEAAEVAIEHGLRRAARLRQSILKQAFEGKLVPQDNTDEPASSLLERIRRERDNGSLMAAKPRTRRARE